MVNTIGTRSTLAPDSAKRGREQDAELAANAAKTRRQELEDKAIDRMNASSLDAIRREQSRSDQTVRSLQDQVKELHETNIRLAATIEALVQTVEYLKSTKPIVSQKP